jgi:DNA helicase-2/ATP-dependent DNA helicase PcrA
MMSNLTEQQRDAVETPADQHVVLEAVPGAGKTTVIAARLDKLINRDHIDPSKIVVATFSKSQAEDMALRIFTKFPEWKSTPLANGFGADSGQICTLHALARRMLVGYYEELKKKNVAKTYQEKKLIEERTKDMFWMIGDKPVGWESILYHINAFKSLADDHESLYPWNQNTLLDYGRGSVGEQHASKWTQVAIFYQEGMHRQNLWTFADMLRECEQRLTRDLEFRDFWRNKFTHILVDEGQDTNAQCMRILHKLDPKALFIVGDSDQTLFRFIGASPDINLRSGFDRRYGANSARFLMTNNFRSHQTLLDRANKLIKNNYGESDSIYLKIVKAFKGEEGPDITWNWYMDIMQEAHNVVSTIADRIEDGDLKPGQVMIMGRLNAQNGPIEIELLKRKIPFVNLGHSSFFGQGVAKIALDYMKLSLDPGDREAFQTIYNVASCAMRTGRDRHYVSTRYLGAEFLNRIEGASDLIQAAIQNKHAKNEKGWSQWEAGVTDLELTFSKLSAYSEEDSAHQFLSDLHQNVLHDWINDQYGVEADSSNSARDDIDILLRLSSDFTVREFLDYAEQLSNTKDVKPEDLVDYVLIGTVYRFKGLERDCGWIIGLSDGVLPHKFALGATPPTDGLPIPSIGSVWDERNVMYVAVTRARTEVHCSGVAIWPNRTEELVPSRFVYEMGIIEEDDGSDDARKEEEHLENLMENS